MPSVWPDPPTVANGRGAEAEFCSWQLASGSQSTTVAARPADVAEAVAQMRTRTTEATKMTTSSAGPLIEILLVIALGLIVASLLSRLVMKLSAARDQRIIMDHSGLGWVHDDRHEHERQSLSTIWISHLCRPRTTTALVPTASPSTSKGKGPHRREGPCSPIRSATMRTERRNCFGTLISCCNQGNGRSGAAGTLPVAMADLPARDTQTRWLPPCAVGFCTNFCAPRAPSSIGDSESRLIWLRLVIFSVDD